MEKEQSQLVQQVGEENSGIGGSTKSSSASNGGSRTNILLAMPYFQALLRNLQKFSNSRGQHMLHDTGLQFGIDLENFEQDEPARTPQQIDTKDLRDSLTSVEASDAFASSWLTATEMDDLMANNKNIEWHESEATDQINGFNSDTTTTTTEEPVFVTATTYEPESPKHSPHERWQKQGEVERATLLPINSRSSRVTYESRIGDCSECTEKCGNAGGAGLRCNAQCGRQGIKYRILQCVWYGTRRPAGNACRHQPRPAVMKVCKSPPCHARVSEMLQMAKLLGRKASRQSNGHTFGEFCVLAADLKRFRSLQEESNDNNRAASSLTANTEANNASNCAATFTSITSMGTELRSRKSLSNVEDCKRKLSKGDNSATVEVFLGGSCNPTTWRADGAIPALNELDISFYNPQVSDWTPDPIELEHRAKETARVLFFVMDSETCASAGAIEAAHIADQNCKQLVLVLHPYTRKQSILNEQIYPQRNQLTLKVLVTRHGLQVMDDIPSGLQRTKDILASIREPLSNIAAILVVVRVDFDCVNPVNGLIIVAQCQLDLSYLGYAQSLINLENLNKTITSQRETLETLQKHSRTKSGAQQERNWKLEL